MPGDLQRPPGRGQLTRALAVNAATKPVNVVVPAAVAVVAAVVGISWLFAVAAVVYVALVLATFFDENEAERVGERRRGERAGAAPAQLVDPQRFAPPIARRLEEALAEEHEIRQTISGSDLEFREVSGEVDGLVASLTLSAQRAQLVYDYLASQDLNELEKRRRFLAESDDPEAKRTAAAVADQIKLGQDLTKTLDRFYVQLEHAVVSLRTIRGELVRISVAGEESRQAEAADRVRDLRQDLAAVADGMREAYARADVAT